MKKIDLLFILLLIGCQEAASLKEESLLIIAHRGASGYAPESTLASFRLANKMNADYLEFDVQMTKDGELVVFHDAKVDRTTNAKGELKQYTLKQLKELDAGSWFNEKYQGEKVLTVREVFEAFGNRTNYFIEIKNPPNDSKIEEKLIALLKEYNLLKKKGQVILHSASKPSLLKMQSLAPETELGILYWNRDEVEIAQAELNEIKDCVSHVVVNQHVLTKADIQKVKEAGFSVHVYTVNDVEMAEKLKTWGADGIITDFPDLLHFF